ncbi:hypothetical protein [Nocardia sp. NPDC050406]|uniref:hypothetical protein n=1 Tax=Nocardia sp. NPDC050406 TaxID=3364318 RepID=UPI0037AE012B
MTSASHLFASGTPDSVSHADRLVRHLFDTGLRLSTLSRTAMDSDLTALLDDLDKIIRDTGLVMLALAKEDLAREDPAADPLERIAS